MKAIFGIDTHHAYKPAIQLFARFRFEKVEGLMAHVANPAVPYAPMEAAAGFEVDYLREIENAGRTALLEARDEGCHRNISSKTCLRFGTPTGGLIEIAEESRADLVAVNAEKGALWSTSYLGSVSRGLTIGCKSSVLIAKGKVKDGLPLKVVLATDHSAASHRWIQRFLSWKPKGIKEIHIVTAYQVNDREAEILEKNLPSLGGMVDGWIEDHLSGLNARLVEQLCDAGYKSTARVVCAKPNDAIRETMQDTQSDVLVIGAQGHGFVERLLIGSVALHQVVAEPYPVLVVRS